MFNCIRNFMREPLTNGIDVDSIEFSMSHRKVLLSKKILYELYKRFYQQMATLDNELFSVAGSRVELGSGSGIMKDIRPEILTSDVKFLPFVDFVARAEELPFANDSLRSIYLLNVFHHLPNPRKFLKEAERVLRPGGGLILTEPYFGLIARLVYPHLHAAESYDLSAAWENVEQTGPFSNANQALSYIIFKRDLNKFYLEFPRFDFIWHQPHTHLWYFLSGGVNYRQLVPDIFSHLASFLEFIFTPLNPVLSLLHTLVLRKRMSR